MQILENNISFGRAALGVNLPLAFGKKSSPSFPTTSAHGQSSSVFGEQTRSASGIKTSEPSSLFGVQSEQNKKSTSAFSLPSNSNPFGTIASPASSAAFGGSPQNLIGSGTSSISGSQPTTQAQKSPAFPTSSDSKTLAFGQPVQKKKTEEQTRPGNGLFASGRLSFPSDPQSGQLAKTSQGKESLNQTSSPATTKPDGGISWGGGFSSASQGTTNKPSSNSSQQERTKSPGTSWGTGFNAVNQQETKLDTSQKESSPSGTLSWGAGAFNKPGVQKPNKTFELSNTLGTLGGLPFPSSLVIILCNVFLRWTSFLVFPSNGQRPL